MRKFKKDFTFKGHKISEWLKIMAIELKHCRYIVYVPLDVVVREILPFRTYPIEEMVEGLLIESIINDGWKEKDKEKFISLLKDFLKENFNMEV